MVTMDITGCVSILFITYFQHCWWVNILVDASLLCKTYIFQSHMITVGSLTNFKSVAYYFISVEQHNCECIFINNGLVIREGDCTPLQYSCLGNPMDRGAWWAAAHGVTKSWAQLSNFTFIFHFHALEKAMAPHSSILAWRIPETEEPGELPSMGLHRVRHN